MRGSCLGDALNYRAVTGKILTIACATDKTLVKSVCETVLKSLLWAPYL